MIALASLEFSDSKYEDAFSLIDKAIEIDPNNAEAYRNRGAMRFFYGDTLKALNDENKAVELAPNNPNALNSRGAILREMGKYKEAIADYNRVLDIDKNNAEAYCRRGIAYLYLGDYDKSISDIETGIKLQPTLEPLVKKYLDEAKQKKSK